jgi:hypothetical protein
MNKQHDIRTKGDCCFNHIIGLPRKEGKQNPMFDYEKLLYDTKDATFLPVESPTLNKQYV